MKYLQRIPLFRISIIFISLLLADNSIKAQSDGKVIFDLGKELEDNRKYLESIEKYQDAALLLLQEKDFKHYYLSQIGIGYNYLDLKQFDKAEAKLLNAIEHYKQTQDTFLNEYPRIMHCLGNVYLDSHKYDDALKYNRLALEYYSQYKDEKERKKYMAYMYNNIGQVFKTKRSMDSALHYFQIALPIKRAVLGPAANSTLRTIKSISGIYQDWGQLDKAIEIQTIALDAAIETNNEDAEAQAYNGLSQMYQRKKDFETSRNYITKAFEIYKKMGPSFKMDIAHSYHQMGNVLEAEKAHQESIQWYIEAKKIYREIHNGKASYQEGNSTMNLGKAYNYLAEQLEANGQNYTAEHPEVLALRAKAIIYYEENERIFTEAIGRDHARWIELWLSKGVCYVENQDTVSAHEIFKKAYDRAYKLAPDKSYDRSLSCLNLARTTSDIDQALNLYQQGLWELSNDWEYDSYDDNPNAKQVFYENWSVEIMTNKVDRLKKLYAKNQNKKHLSDGLKTSIAADALLQESRATFLTQSAKIFLGKMGHGIYSQGTDLCFTLENNDAQAFEFIEKDKGLVLLEALQSGRKLDNLLIPDSLSSKVNRLSEKIDELKTQQNQLKQNEKFAEIGSLIFDLQEERKSIQDQIAKLYPITSRISQSAEILNLAEVQKLLKNNEVVYEYLQAPNDLFVLKIERSSSQLYKISTSKFQLHLDSLLKIINDFDIAKNKSNSKDIWDKYQYHSHELYKILLPAYNNEDLLIIPDGKLNYLPFELLLTDKIIEGPINYSRLPYLLKSSIIKYGFSSSLHFAAIAPSNSTQETLLAMAPSYPPSPSGLMAMRDGFSDLAFTKDEVNSINKIISGEVISGIDATVEKFKSIAPNFRMLHLAMHAYTHDDDPMLSGMIFSETEDNKDNVLHAYELYNMDLPGDMVVLSACNTGLGQFEKGEGVMSLGRAFRHAGIQNIIMSLWQANDEATSKIMTSFYQNLNDGEPKATALRNAKLTYLESSANVFPHYWGSFVLLGHDQPIIVKSNSHWIWILGIASLIGIMLYFFRLRAKLSS